MQAARLTAAIIFSTVVGGSALYFMAFFVSGGDLKNVTLWFLSIVWEVIGVIFVLPLALMYVFAKNAVRRRWFMALAWVPLAVFANFLVRAGAVKPIGETVHLIAAITGGIFVINFIFWTIAGHRGDTR